MNELVRKITENFHRLYQELPEMYSQAPGRINIIGEHTDYTGGLSLPAAIDAWTVCAWKSRNDNEIKIYSANMNELWETSWAELSNSIDNSWKKYVGGSLTVFKERYFSQVPQKNKGFELFIEGNIPLGKGLSSSASIELSILNGLAKIFKVDASALDLALLAQLVEHEHLLVKSGLLDQFASQFSQKDSALLIDFRNLKTQCVKMDPVFDNYSWVLVDSLVKRELSNSKYSERVEEYETLLNHAHEKGKEHLRDLEEKDLANFFGELSENLKKRAQHIVSENRRTVDTLKALEEGRPEDVGRLLQETHQSLSKDYEVSHPYLDFLVASAQTIPGVMGGRMMGGGFGGCALFLIEKNLVNDFSYDIRKKYLDFSQLDTQPRSYQFVDGASAWSYGH